MGYMHINNLYKQQDILNDFKECYALEKVHGTSAHISYNYDGVGQVKPPLHFFSGGAKHEPFVALFSGNEKLFPKLQEVQHVTIYGEAYGGKILKMGKTYGPDLRFVVFDVKIGETWLNVPDAARFAEQCGLEFVDYVRIPTTMDAIDAERDRDSTQAIRNGMGTGHKREGVVLRPVKEYTLHGNRVIVKHKRAEFMETNTVRDVVDPEKLKVLEDAQAIAQEWVTPMRIEHVLDKIPDASMEKMGDIIRAMQEDVSREAAGEIVWSEAVAKTIGRFTAKLTKEHFQKQLHNEHPATNQIQ
jgi:hypothetical protein